MSLTVKRLLPRITHEEAAPIEPIISNAATIAAMKEARAGGLHSATTINGLMDALNADD